MASLSGRSLEYGRVVPKIEDNEKFTLPEPDSKLKRGDEVMIVTHSRNIEKLHARWSV